MKIREYKRLQVYLKLLIEKLQQDSHSSVLPEIKKHFIKEELVDIVQWLYRDVYPKKELQNQSNEYLLELIGNDTNLLFYIIEQFEARITNTISYSQKKVSHFFSKAQKELHYLASKPVEDWDNYDKSNYHSLLTKTNTTKKVFAIFTSDALAEDVHTVTIQASYFFDTKEEAKAEIENIIKEENFQRGDLTIHKLWLIQNQ